MSLNPELHQRMLELIYDLLSQEEASQLRAEIAADAELARQFAQVQKSTELLSAAARLEVPRISLSRMERPMPAANSQPGVTATSTASLSATPRWTNWLVGLAAAVLVGLSTGGYLYHRSTMTEIAGNHMRLVVTGPARLSASVDNAYEVALSTVDGSPLSKEVTFAVYAPGGGELLREKLNTSNEGKATVVIPPSLPLETGTRLEVLAAHLGEIERVDTRLEVDPLKFVTQLSLDKPLYQPGETVYYRSLTLSRFGLESQEQLPLHFEIQGPDGAIVPGSELDGYTDRSVGNGAFEIPPSLNGGEYTLVARSPSNAFPEEKRTFFIRRYRLPRLKKELEFTRDSYAPGDTVVADVSANRAEGGPAAEAALQVIAKVDGQVVHESQSKATAKGTQQVQFTLPTEIEKGGGELSVIIDDGGTRETIAKTIPINLGKVDVKFYPEGGDLVAGLENRVYFVGKDPLGEPVHLEGTIVSSDGQVEARLSTTHEGMGMFSFTPQLKQTYRLKISSPVGVKSEPELPAIRPDARLVLNTGKGVFAAHRPLEFSVDTLRSGQPLVVVAACRGVQIGQSRLTTVAGPNAVQLTLPEAIGGVIRLTVFDYSSDPPRPLAERLVYREPARQLRVQLADHSEKYAPGETVEMNLMVTDEQGKPVPATLGVAVVDDTLLSLADDDTPRMSTHFLLTTEVEKPEDLEDADFYLTGDAKAKTALDLLLGTQGWRRFVEKSLEEIEKAKSEIGLARMDSDEHQDAKQEQESLTRLAALGVELTPPAMFDNQAALLPEYERDLEEYGRQRARLLSTVSLLGGIGLLIVVALLVLMRLASGARIWLPTLAAVGGCLVIGILLVRGKSQPAATDVAVAFANYKNEPAVQLVSTQPEALNMAMMEGGAMPAPGAPAAAFLPGARGIDPAAAPLADGAVPPPAPAGALQKQPMLRQQDLNGAVRFGAQGGGGFGGGLGGGGEGRFADANLLEREMAKRANRRKDLGADAEDRFAGRPMAAGARRMIGKAGIADMAEPESLGFLVREYAHQHLASEPGVRSDFTETLFWHPLLIADADGRATIHFELSDAVTTFRVLADAHDGAGRIGSGGGELISRIPFNIQPKLPLEVTAGDQIDLPVAIVNDTRNPLSVQLQLAHNDLLTLEGIPQRTIDLIAAERSRQFFRLAVSGPSGLADIDLRGQAGQLADGIRKSLSVVPPGFPIHQTYSGQLNGDQELTIRLPQDWVPGSLEVELQAFPSTLSDLQQGMESILREPHGCFEQASTSNYPNVLTLQYMQEHNVANPEITRRAKDLLANGYQKLTGYECPEKGYEWFGSNPGHEALTAYGLMEFRDMSQVHEVDPAMIARTANWLRSRRDGTGGYQRNPRALDSFGAAPAAITNAYITWALSESGEKELTPELKYLAAEGEKSDDPYLLALAAASMINVGQPAEGKPLLDKLSKAQQADGHLTGKQGSITRSGGHSLDVETTALAALAWLKLPEYRPQANKAIDWIVKARQGDGFGSTQATILALKVLVEFSKLNRKTAKPGEFIVKSHEQTLGKRTFAAGEHETLILEGLAAKLKAGENELTLSLTGENQMPYSLNVSYRSQQPASDPNCPLRLTTRLAKEAVVAGQTVALLGELSNNTEQGQPMAIAIIGLPAGLEVRAEQLEELKKAGTIDFYETRAREVIFYWRALAPQKKIAWQLDLIAEIPGRYTGPASRTYLYYTPEQKQWTDPLAVEISRE